MTNRESESSNVSLAKISKWSGQPSADEGEIMAQKKFLVTGATGDTGGYTVEQLGRSQLELKIGAIPSNPC